MSAVEIPVAAIHKALMVHYRAHARVLPWRIPPGETPGDTANHAYRVWLSEIMLQQTTVAAVKGYFMRFTEYWPTVGALAAADDSDVMREWAGLGYYARARNLLKTARIVAGKGGQFPQDETGLLELPGIGRYTAAAIASIGFGKRAVVIDGNVERIITRLAAIEAPLPQARPRIAAIADALTPERHAGDFAQAMMDLGATICIARAPRCGFCPIAFGCKAHDLGRETGFPVKPPKKAKPSRTGTAYWIERNGQVALIRRPGRGMLGGMLAMPSDGWDGRPSTAPDGIEQQATRPLGHVRHVFTHFALTLSVVAIDGSACKAADDWEWWPVDELDAAGLPSLFSKAAALGRVLQEELPC